MLKVKCRKSGETLHLNAFWLRDHCRCTVCYNVATRQRKFNILDLPDDIYPNETAPSADGSHLHVTWNDGHRSIYSFEFLIESQLPRYMEAKSASRKIEWDRDSIVKSAYAKIKLKDLVSKEDEVRNLVKSLWCYGIAFIEEVPLNATMTEMALRTAFPIMKTFFGEMWTITDNQEFADTAYTSEHIGSHTDNTYFCDAAGLQTFHCIKHNGTGGENFFVDGFKVANDLKKLNPKAYNILTKVLVPSEYFGDGQHHVYYAPVIRTNPINGEIIQVRLNMYDRAALNTLPQTEVKEFYDSFKAFIRLVQTPDNEWTIKLQPGKVVVFDNWRVFHARHAFTGSRVLTGCYVQRTDFLSKARVLGIID